MGLLVIRCEHCGKNLARFSSQEGETQTFKCSHCGKITTRKDPRMSRQLLGDIIKKYGGKTIEEFEADNGIF